MRNCFAQKLLLLQSIIEVVIGKDKLFCAKKMI